MGRLRDAYEALLLDLDGTLYRGAEVIDGAPAALADATGQRLVYVTNNASRRPEVVGHQLRDLGFDAAADDVVTSAQAAARVLAERLAPGSRVLVVGADDLAAEIEAVGLLPVRRFDTVVPSAVVQGHSPSTGWADLAEAAYAIRAGALWVAANTDRTLPNERGLAPGNGAMVAALCAATDQEPVVAGKPHAPLLEDALLRAGTRRALVVGDRLDTDIEGADRVGLDSLLVLTGVSTLAELASAPAAQQPTYVSDSLAALNYPPVDTDPAATEDLAARLSRHPGRAVLLRGAVPAATGTEIR